MKYGDTYIVEVYLSSNNLVGTMHVPRFLAPLNKRVLLNLTNNTLGGVIKFNLLY